MMVHWVGEGSNVIICLARDPVHPSPSMTQTNPSAVFISYDYGDTYENKTEFFKLPNGNYSILEKFYNHPKYNTHVRNLKSFHSLGDYYFVLVCVYRYNQQFYIRHSESWKRCKANRTELYTQWTGLPWIAAISVCYFR